MRNMQDVRLLAYAAVAHKWTAATGGTTVSSGLLSAETGFSDSEIRRDLAAAGIKGRRGHGYDSILLHVGVIGYLGMPADPAREAGASRLDAAKELALDLRALAHTVIVEADRNRTTA